MLLIDYHIIYDEEAFSKERKRSSFCEKVFYSAGCSRLRIKESVSFV